MQTVSELFPSQFLGDKCVVLKEAGLCGFPAPAVEAAVADVTQATRVGSHLRPAPVPGSDHSAHVMEQTF